MKENPDINDTFCNEGEDAVRARHDKAELFKGNANGAVRPTASANEQGHQPLARLDEWDAGDDIAPPTPREWLMGTVFCRRFVSSLLGDGGVGKSALRVAQAMGLAIGRPLTGEYVHKRTRVLIVSLEDDAEELRRRVLAARIYHNVSAAELKGWLFLAAPSRESGKLMMMNSKGRAVEG